MNNILRPTLELTVIIPGMILSYLPVKSTLKISLPKLIAWLFPLLIALCILGGILCSALQIGTGIIYNIICILFLLAVWYPATHTVRIMIDDDNFAQIWYVFWILPLIFIRLNLFMVPKYDGTLYTGRILQIYIVVSLVLLIILALFYTLFLLMANSLNRNARLQQENYLLSIQQERYTNLCNAIEETRQARHDMRHHFLQLSSMAERNTIPFHVQIDLPAQISVDETDFCLVLSNLLENALEASLKTAKFRQRIDIKIYRHASNLILFLLNLFTYTSSATAISDQYTSLPHQTGYVNAPRQISD